LQIKPAEPDDYLDEPDAPSAPELTHEDFIAAQKAAQVRAVFRHQFFNLE